MTPRKPAGTMPNLEEGDRARGRACFLVYVLGYEDLLAQATVSLRIDAIPSPITVGRASDGKPFGLSAPAEIRMPDAWMSAAHAVLERQGDGWSLRDEGHSRNGTFVNGVRVRQHALLSGDLIEMGRSLLCYRVVDAAQVGALEVPSAQLRLGPTRTHCAEVAVLLRDLRRIAASKESVLILAETGAGKEFVAQEVHRLSGRAGQLCPVDCGAVPESLFEATFFGHRRGAFTGAADARTGELVRADGGTLFLDEVANMSTASQAKLLRVLEDGRVTPLGAAESQTVDVRWIAATNRELFADQSAFRGDLLRRLAGYVARIPPLRRRREDLGELSAHLLREAGIDRASITPAAARILFTDAFPGNLRQLRTTLRSAAILADRGQVAIEEQHLPTFDPQTEPVTDPGLGRPRRNGVPDAAEIEAALSTTQGNVVRAAQLLETHPRQLYRWIEKLALPLTKYRQ